MRGRFIPEYTSVAIEVYYATKRQVLSKMDILSLYAGMFLITNIFHPSKILVNTLFFQAAHLEINCLTLDW